MNPGDVWQSRDGKLTILSREHIRAGRLFVRHRGVTLDWPLSAGRVRTEGYLLSLACEMYGVPGVH